VIKLKQPYQTSNQSFRIILFEICPDYIIQTEGILVKITGRARRQQGGKSNTHNFSLINLVYFNISYPNNIYLPIAKEFICQKSVEIGKLKYIFFERGKLKYIHLFNGYILYYFDTFDLLINYNESLVKNKNCQKQSNYILFHLFRFGPLIET